MASLVLVVGAKLVVIITAVAKKIMAKKTFFSQSQPAFSLIEILVAVALISMILSGLSVTLLYSTRSIQDTKFSSRAADQAQSCLDVFRNLRDSNAWTFFCQRLNTPLVITGGTVSYNGNNICNTQDSNGTYTLTFSSTNGNHSPCSSLSKNAKGLETATVTVTVTYKNFDGNDREVNLFQNFTQLDNEAAYSI